MPSKFDFISPDILLREVDLSEVQQDVQDDGILIVGYAKKGPAMKPVRISSIDDLEAIFGAPQPGIDVDDVWRNGNYANPTYGLYAAKAWLASETSPVTFIRLVGESITTTSVKAGWNLGGGSFSTSDPASNTTAYGLWVVPSASSGETSGGLAAIIYAEAAALTLSGTIAGTTSDTTSSAGMFIVSEGNDYGGFNLEIHTAAGTSTKHSFSLDPNSTQNFIRNVLNTNPHSLASAAQKDTTYKYFLGETFETDLYEKLNTAGSASAGKQFGIILPLASGSAATNWINHQRAATTSKTGWFIANDAAPQQNTGSFSSSNMQKLFRLESLHEGEDFQKNYAVRIKLEKLGTNAAPDSLFGVEVLQKDALGNFVVAESFSSCNLNEDSDNFVAKKIGDMVLSYDTTKEKYTTTGKYPNKSSYVRVEMDTNYKSVGRGALPFGFYGPAKPKGFTITSGSANLNAGGSTAYVMSAISSSIYGGHDAASQWAKLESDITASFVWPELRTTDSGSNNGNHYSKSRDFGVRHFRSNSFQGPRMYGNINNDYLDLTRILPSGLDIHSSGGALENSFIFTLDELVQDANNSSKFYFLSGSHATTPATAYTALSGTAALIETAEVNKIVSPFFGGFDGTNVSHVDPFSSAKHLTSQSEVTHYAYAAMHKMIDSIKNSEAVQYDVVSVPGMTNTSLVRDLIDNTEDRGDALAIVDVDSGYQGSHEYNTAAKNDGSVSNIITNIKAQDYDTSYAACYYPEIQLASSEGSAILPPSVAGIGALASSDAASGAPWFAPAGFNRGGIKELGGTKGPKVSKARESLLKSDRDKLYQVDINPIANFPSEGPVVFGQKTLQQTPSALDRINVRRLMIYLKKRIGDVARTILFDNNVQATWNRFKAGANPILEDAKSRFGLAEYKLILDETTTTPDYIDRNIMYAKVFIKPAYAIEFIAIDFNITNSGIEF